MFIIVVFVFLFLLFLGLHCFWCVFLGVQGFRNNDRDANVMLKIILCWVAHVSKPYARNSRLWIWTYVLRHCTLLWTYFV